jgi:protein-L-isoaspartate(D-aspartate) O-methyltransferase
VTSLDERAVPFRRAMVGVLADLGITDEAVLQVMAGVPRHRFVDRFWAVPPGRPPATDEVRCFTVDEDADDETLALIYESTTALVTRGPVVGQAATSSLSAPVIVALMLVELGLGPGLRVLEIGTGSGYHAALMATLVGEAAGVTTVDIDDTLIAETGDRLDRLGYGAMTVRGADGTEGAADRAPFDRIVATVGCADLAPAWIAQLAPGGVLLLPLAHGELHPRVRIEAGDPIVGRFTGHSGFVRIRGRQQPASLWPRPGPIPEPTQTEPLERALARALAPPDERRRARTPGLWDFATCLALRDRRAAGVGLAEPGSEVVVRPGGLVAGGPRGPVLRDRLLAVAGDWLRLGRPGLPRYTLRFSRRDTADPGHGPDRPTGPWTVDRIDYRQTVTLTPP